MIDMHALFVAYAECAGAGVFVGGLAFLLGLAKARSSR